MLNGLLIECNSIATSLAPGEGSAPSKKFGPCTCAVGFVRIIDHRHFGISSSGGGILSEIGQEPPVCVLGKFFYFTAVPFGVRAKHRVARNSHDGDVAGI